MGTWQGGGWAMVTWCAKCDNSQQCCTNCHTGFCLTCCIIHAGFVKDEAADDADDDDND